MKLTDDARKFLYHCLVMDDTNPNTLWRWNDDDLVHYWTKDHNEDLPEHWVVKDAE